jgi:hypothetical protein
VTFLENEGGAFALAPARQNYAGVLTFLLKRGRAILVTGLPVLLAILATLTINPLAAYGLSRFSVRGKDKIILFFLATMAFPAMVSAIPAYLLMRDLGLCSTPFSRWSCRSRRTGWPSSSSKAFSTVSPASSTIPPRLTVRARCRFSHASPMMKPILAIQSLYAFLWAYNSWEWALIICQKKNDVDHGGLDVPGGPLLVGGHALACHRGLRRDLDPDAVDLSLLPEDHSSRDYHSVDEVADSQRSDHGHPRSCHSPSGGDRRHHLCRSVRSRTSVQSWSRS